MLKFNICKVLQGVWQSLTGMQADMLTILADVPGVIRLVEQGTMLDGLPYIITQPFGSLLAFGDSAEMILSVVHRAASIIQDLAFLEPPVFHRDISIGNLIYHGDGLDTFLIDFGTAVTAPSGCNSAVGTSITGTCTFIARGVLEGEGYSLSSELESLMYVTVFLAVAGHAHWGNKPIGSVAVSVRVHCFIEQESFEKYIVRRCRPDLVGVVRRLRNLFWQPVYQRNVTALQFQQALQQA